MDSSQIKEIQNKLTDIIVYFEAFCKKHKIVYYLAGGSAIGALRHKDFIPWDDDFDVLMTKDNYDIFLNIARTKLDTSQFYLQEENTKEWPLFFTKLRMNGTTYIEEDTKNREMHKGFFIDIFCLHNLSQNIIYRYLQYFCARLITAQALSQRGYNTKSVKKRIVIVFSKYFIGKRIKKILLKIVNSKKNVKTAYVGNLFTIGSFKTVCYPRAFWETPRNVKFGNFILPVGEQVEKYLTLVFGDFMKIPDEKTRRKYPSHMIFYDTEVDYKEYEGREF